MLFGRRKKSRAKTQTSKNSLVASAKVSQAKPFQPVDRLDRFLKFHTSDVQSGRYRIQLYRFLAQTIPVASACVSTWARLSAAPGEYSIIGGDAGSRAIEAQDRLRSLSKRIYQVSPGNPGSMVTFLTDIFTCIYRDGVFGGFLTVFKDGIGVDRFIPIDAACLAVDEEAGGRLVLNLDNGTLQLDREDFYFVPLNSDLSRPLGQSILQTVPFVAYIEQQLVDDMRRASHNSGYHRLHVKVTPPDRMAGESDEAYIDRINAYFDSTVSMIKSCQVDENPVTWDNVAIEHIGPDNVRTVTNSWFLNHRGMIEEICAGTNLAPFLLGYSFGATSTWSSFKFDLVMRSVKSVQAQVASFLEWIGNVELALAGYDYQCRFRFDNSFVYQAVEQAGVESTRIESLLALYREGLIDKETAREKAESLI